MIRRIEALGFRALRSIEQEIGRFQLLVGPNGSGKSTFLDVPAFIGDVLRVGPRGAIEGLPASRIPFRAADLRNLTWQQEADQFELAVELELPERLSRISDGYARARYELGLSVDDGGAGVVVSNETLWLCPQRAQSTPELRELFPRDDTPKETIVQRPRQRAPQGWRKVIQKVSDSGNDNFASETGSWSTMFRIGPARAALANLPEDEEQFPVATWVKRTLMEGEQRVVLDAEAMRRPSSPITPRHFLPDGSNLPSVVHELRSKFGQRYTEWIAQVRTAIPELVGVETVERPEDRHRYLVVEYANGLKAPSWTVSDGTLRMLALTLIGFVPNLEGLFLIEEPENGIHPKAVETVFQSISNAVDAQVLCASHSPVMLRLAEPADLLCFAKGVNGATDIVLGTAHPQLQAWKGEVSLGDLFAAGVLG